MVRQSVLMMHKVRHHTYFFRILFGYEKSPRNNFFMVQSKTGDNLPNEQRDKRKPLGSSVKECKNIKSRGENETH